MRQENDGGGRLSVPQLHGKTAQNVPVAQPQEQCSGEEILGTYGRRGGREGGGLADIRPRDDSMKYYGDKPLARYMGYLMAQELRETEFFDDIDFLLPVPLTRWRKLERGYNQAEEIARGIEQVTGTEVRNDILKRVKFSGSQTRLTEEDRMTNVEQAFRLRIENPETLRGKHILIIDDVITSSATTRACAKQLAQIHEVRVSILALATPQTESLRIENIKVHNEESIKNIDNGDHRSSDALSM